MDKQVEQRILNKEKRLDRGIQTRLYENSTNRKRKPGKDLVLNFCFLSSEIVRMVLKNMLKKIPISFDDVQSLNLHEFWNERSFKKVLERPFTKEISQCYINFNRHNFLIAKVNFRNIFKYLSLVTKKFILSGLLINQKTLRKIIQIGRHIETISFGDCIIRFNIFELSNCINYSIKEIKIIVCNGQEVEYWNQHPRKILYLLQTFSKTNLKESLKKLEFNVPCFTANIQIWAKETGMNNTSCSINN
ncbi:unnamed protein product [Moneuplotes crassus]|uniref:Uncharacterized protein n=1 Tax=Euplotes crassus TaxID=5936 RepID=A0AAD1XUL9_EUPCR|nr:unnamed protein product [Moneuplotes crassus]